MMDSDMKKARLAGAVVLGACVLRIDGAALSLKIGTAQHDQGENDRDPATKLMKKTMYQ